MRSWKEKGGSNEQGSVQEGKEGVEFPQQKHAVIMKK